jgi:hypothetical protein
MAFGAGSAAAPEPNVPDLSQPPAIGSTPGTPARSSAPGSSAVTIAASVAAGATTAIPQFDPVGTLALTAGSPESVAPALTTFTRRGSERRLAKPTAPAQGGGMGPDAPTGPPGHATAAVSGAAFGGSGAAHGCAILAGVLALSCWRLRRHRVRSVLPGPVGVVFLLQRPG